MFQPWLFPFSFCSYINSYRAVLLKLRQKKKEREREKELPPFDCFVCFRLHHPRISTSWGGDSEAWGPPVVKAHFLLNRCLHGDATSPPFIYIQLPIFSLVSILVSFIRPFFCFSNWPLSWRPAFITFLFSSSHPDHLSHCANYCD